MSKRIISILLVITMLFATAGCGTMNKNGYRNPAAMDEIDFSEEPVTITYLTIGDKPTNGRTEEVIEKLNKILVKRLNAKLDIYYVGWSDYLTNYNNTVKTKELEVDLIGTGSDWLDAWPNVIEGNFLPLSEDMIRKYCGITYTNVPKSIWRSCSYEGSIYFIPENEYTQWTNHGFIYREDLAKEAGLYEINSWDDLSTYFYSVREKHPDMIPWDTDGKTSIVPLGYIMSKRKYAPIYELTTYGLWGEDLDNKGKIISPFYKGDELIEYAKLMKEWRLKGVFRSDAAMVGNNEDEFYMGESAVVQHHTQNFYTVIKPKADLDMPDTNVKFYWFGKENGNLLKVSNLHGAMAVSAYSKNPERALMVYDMLRNDQECYNLIRYGIEGIQYEFTNSHMIDKPSGYNESKDSFVTNFWWGRRDEYEVPESSYALDDYYTLVNSYEHVAEAYPWEGVPFATPYVNDELKAITAICDEYIPQISMGAYVGPPEEKVAEFRAKLKQAGFERITGQLQRIYNEQ